MMGYLDEKVIWITGASSGIGEELVYQLAKKNCKLIISARRENELERVKANCSEAAIAVLPFDLNDYHNAKTYVDQAVSVYGTVDLMILNGGISQRSLIAETDFSVYKKLIDIDYLANVALSKAILPHFISKQQGHFAVVTSLMGKFGSPYRSGYCGAKHALHGYFDVLRMEHDKDNVSVTMICPGFVNTNVAINALTADGSAQQTQDGATETGLSPAIFCKRMIRAIERKKFEAYIAKKEVMGIYVKRFFPKLLHKIVIRSKVT